MHEEVSDLRQLLITEGRARRAAAAAVGGSSSSPTQQAAAMIARRFSNGAIYPAAYASAGMTIGSSTADGCSTASNSDVLQQSWESAVIDEQGRQKVGFYGSYASAGQLASGATGAMAGSAEGWVPYKGSEGEGRGRISSCNGSSSSDDGDDMHGPSSRSSGALSAASFDSNSDTDAELLPGSRRARLSSKRGGWRAAGKAARASVPGRQSVSGTCGSGSSRVSRLPHLDKPQTTRAISKPYRSSSAELVKAAEARRSSIRKSSRAAVAAVVMSRSGRSSDSSSNSSDDSKTDIFELTARRGSIKTSQGRLNGESSMAVAVVCCCKLCSEVPTANVSA